MTRIEMADSRLLIEMLGWDKLWAFKSRLEFPLEHVMSLRPWNEERDGGFRACARRGRICPG
jgi:hypothetical protein